MHQEPLTIAQSHAKLRDLIRQLGTLSRQKYELVQVLLQEQGFDIHQLLILPQPREQLIFPLSLAQQRLWLLDQLDPGNPAFNLPEAVTLSGPLDHAALEQSLNALIQRHESLRTTFRLVDGQPAQIIAPAAPLSLALFDLSSYPTAEQQTSVQHMLREEAHWRFDLARGPLLRAILLRLDREEHVLLFTMHHIISDGWSSKILVRELALLYTLFREDRSASVDAVERVLPELPIQYADFAAWQRQQLQGPALDAQIAFWKAQLVGAPPILRLPTVRPRPPVPSSQGATHVLTISDTLYVALKAFSRQQDATLFTVLLAAFQVLLHRYSGQNTIVVGTPIAGRNRIEVEGLIGFFVNTLAIRVDVRNDPEFREFVAHVQSVVSAAHDHQDLPFDMVVESVQPRRSRSHPPLVQVAFILQDATPVAVEIPGLEIGWLTIENATSTLDLLFELADTGSGLKGSFQYNTDVFDAAMIKRLGAHFLALLQEIVEDPQQRVSRLRMITASERRQMLAVQRQRSTTPAEQSLWLSEVMVTHATTKPEAVAVVSGTKHISYATLDRQARRIAYQLQQGASGSAQDEWFVGLCCEDPIEIALGVLAILKAGGTCVPIPIDMSLEHIKHMFARTQMNIVLTTADLRDHLPPSSATIVMLSDIQPEIQRAQDTLHQRVMSDETLALVLYSVTSGELNGVMVSQGALAARCEVYEDTFRLKAHSRIRTLNQPDIWMVLLALHAGATLVVSPFDRPLTDPPVSPALPTDIVIGMGVESKHPHQPLVLSDDLCVVLPPSADVSEPTPYVLRGQTASPSYEILLTTPEANGQLIAQRSSAEIYVLDTHFQLAPVGVPGDLYTGSKGLPRGYQCQAALTADRFVPHPFSTQPGRRLYKTGDQARYQPDGSITILGALHEQPIMRGYQLDLRMITARLLHHPAVQEAVVVQQEIESGPVVIAYVVLQQGATCSPNDLTSFLKSDLPDYMVPDAIQELPALPCRQMGSINYSRLTMLNPSKPGLRPNDAFNPGASDKVPDDVALQRKRLEERRSELPTAKQALLEKRLRGKQRS